MALRSGDAAGRRRRALPVETAHDGADLGNESDRFMVVTDEDFEDTPPPQRVSERSASARRSGGWSSRRWRRPRLAERHVQERGLEERGRHGQTCAAGGVRRHGSAEIPLVRRSWRSSAACWPNPIDCAGGGSPSMSTRPEIPFRGPARAGHGRRCGERLHRGAPCRTGRHQRRRRAGGRRERSARPAGGDSGVRRVVRRGPGLAAPPRRAGRRGPSDRTAPGDDGAAPGRHRRSRLHRPRRCSARARTRRPHPSTAVAVAADLVRARPPLA